MNVCTFFGHRDCSDNIKEAVSETVEKLILENDVGEFLVGDKGSFDRIVRGVLGDMKSKYPYISYSVVLSHLPKKTAEHEDFSDTVFPEGIETVTPRFAISWRNRWMVKQADYVVAYICHSWGGAAQFVALAHRQSKIVINLGTLQLD